MNEEAEKYFEDFLFNVEDTDISSFDEERSDASSIVRDPGLRNSVAGTYERVLKTAPLPADGDGVVLPWLEWETSVAPSSPCKSKVGLSVSSGNKLCAAALPAHFLFIFGLFDFYSFFSFTMPVALLG